MAELLDTDLMLVNRNGKSYSISGAVLRDSLGGAKPVDPKPDEITANPDFQGGTGTKEDPYILQPITVKPAGNSGQTVETITIAAAGAGPGQIIQFTDLSTGAGTRFAQPIYVTAADGKWSGNLVYKDAPNSTSDTSYTGDIQIGSVYFRWVVTQEIVDAVIDKPVILAPGSGEGLPTPITDVISTNGILEVGGNTTLTFDSDKDLLYFNAGDEATQSDESIKSTVISVDLAAKQMVVAGPKSTTSSGGVKLRGIGGQQYTKSLSHTTLRREFAFNFEAASTEAAQNHIRLFESSTIADMNGFYLRQDSIIYQPDPSKDVTLNLSLDTWYKIVIEANANTGKIIITIDGSVVLDDTFSELSDYMSAEGADIYPWFSGSVGTGQQSSIGYFKDTWDGGSVDDILLLFVDSDFNVDSGLNAKAITEVTPVGAFEKPGSLYPVVFGWTEGQTVYGPVSEAPEADALNFVGSIPSGLGITAWGNAAWEVSTDVAFGSPMVATKSITPGTQQTLAPGERGAINLEAETQYYARLKYDSSSPVVASEYSNIVTFKTGESDKNAKNEASPGDPWVIRGDSLDQLEPLPNGDLAINGACYTSTAGCIGADKSIWTKSGDTGGKWTTTGRLPADAEKVVMNSGGITYLTYVSGGNTMYGIQAPSPDVIRWQHTFSDDIEYLDTFSFTPYLVLKNGDLYMANAAISGDPQFRKISSQTVPLKRIAFIQGASDRINFYDAAGLDFDGNAYLLRFNAPVESR